MTLEMEMQQERNGSQKERDGPKSLMMEATDCDTSKDDDWNENGDVPKQQRTLRSGSRNHYDQRSKRMKFVPDDSLIDSDNENELVIDIDCDSSTEDTSSKVSKDFPKEDVEQEKKYTLRPKTQNNGLTSWKSYDEVASLSDESPFEKDEEDEKDERKVEENWLKVHKTKKKRSKHSKRHHHKENKAVHMQDKVALSKKVTDDSRILLSEMECPICQEKFVDSHSFTIHIREHNTDKSTHICKICMKQLSSASSLDRHMYVHSGERPFECTVCRLRFTTNGNMHRHMKTHLPGLKPPKSKKDRHTHKRSFDGKIKDGSCSSSDSSNSPSEVESIINGNIKQENSESKHETSECRVCGKEFLSPASLQNHMELHSGNPIKCSTCKSMCLNYTEYIKHSCIYDNKENSRFKAYSTKLGFYDLAFLEFTSTKFPIIAKNICELQLRHPSSIFFSWECKTCSKAFPSNAALEQHESNHGNSSRACDTCKCDFSTVSEFRYHQLKHRLAEEVSVDTKDENDDDDDEKETPDKSCPSRSPSADFMAMLGLCGTKPVAKKETGKLKHFKAKEYFNCGWNINESGSDVGCDFADIGSIISLTSKTALPNLRASPVTASPASPVHATSGNVPVSPIIEGSANPLQVAQWSPDVEPEESSVFALSEDLSVSAMSENGDGFTCQKCNDSFATASELKDHFKTHGKGTLHMCKFCDYETNDKSTLKRHLRKHNGEHPFKCSICDYVFTTKANGHRHVRNKHKLVNQEAADAVVYNPNMLEGKDPENEPNSTETVCKYCKQDFKYNRVLRHHLRSLNNSCSRKPYSCPICKQGFSTKNNCIRHITNHHPEFRDKAKELAIVNEISNSLLQESNMSQSEDISENESSPLDQPLNLVVGSEVAENLVTDMEHEDYPLDKDAETLKVAMSLVSLQSLAPPQDSPLDLTVCALNLSMRNIEVEEVATGLENTQQQQCITNSSRNSMPNDSPPAISQEESTSPDPKESSPCTDQEHPMNLSAKQSDPPQSSAMAISFITDLIASENANASNASIPIMCFPQTISPINGLINKKASTAVPFVFSTPVVPYITTVSNPVDISSSEKSKNLQRVKKFSCEICFKGFTLKSNRERHIKNHHPEHARPPRSRNYIPTLSPTSIQKQGSSTLSDRTRDALRVALIAKSGTTLPKNDNSSAVFTQFPALTVQIPCSTVGTKLTVTSDNNTLCNADNRSDMVDLASVSAVIDTVNCQPFKEYLNKANESSDNHDVMDLTPPESNTVPETENGKKSSYAKCPKSIDCTYCKRKFPWKSSLSRHFLTHTGLKPHKCPKCPLSFTTKSNRDRHLYRQHKDSEELGKFKEKLYQCDFCPNAHFSTRGKLKKHNFLKHPSTAATDDTREMLPSSSSNKSDTSHESELADAAFSSDDARDSLDCHVCGASFKAQHDLLIHLKKSHTKKYNNDSKNKEHSNPKSKELSESNSTDKPNEPQLPCIVKVEPEDADMNNVPAINPEASTSNTTAKPAGNLPKKNTNSLLCLFAAAQQHRARFIDNTEESSKTTSEFNNNENELILDLLGLKDPEFIDEMLDSAVRTHIKKEVNA